MCFLRIGDTSAHLCDLKVLQELENLWTASFESGAGEQSSYRRSVEKPLMKEVDIKSLSENFGVEKNTLSTVCQTENVRVCALESFKLRQINNQPSVW